tara:strand:+ start:87 stop:1328 length:1242 start_codon:yes stop_codon:yes gene_type:complete
MSNIKVSSDIDTFLRKSTKEEAATFLGLEDTKAVWGQITGTLSNQTDLVSALALKGSASQQVTNTTNIATNTASIATNATNIATNVTNIATNVTDIATNATNIATNVTSIAGKQDTLTFGIANTNAVKIDNTSAAANSGDICKFAGSGIMPYKYADLKYDLGVDNKAPIASPTFTGDVTAPRLITNEIQSVGTTTGTAQPITYDSKEHRFRDYDETPSNLMVIKKADGVPIGKVGINHNNPVSALHVVGGHTSGGGISNEALRVVGSGLFTSTDQTALVVAGDTDDDTAFAGTLLKLKRDAGVGETVDEINTGYVGSNGGGIYSGSSGNAAFIQVINGRKLEIATGATSTRRLQISDTGIDVTGSITSDGYTQFGSLTTTARNALTASNGMVIYNSTLNKFQGYENGAWVNLV